MSATELLNAVLQLSVSDRRELILQAWESLEDDDPLLDEIPGLVESAGLATEIERRIEQAIADPSQLHDWEDVRLEARQFVMNRNPS